MTVTPTGEQIPGPQATAALMHRILDNIVSVFESEGVDLPAKRYIAVGGTSHDCEQLTVSFRQLYLGPPGIESEGPQPCDAPRTAVLVIELVRCIPTPAARASSPPSGAISSKTEEQTRDAWLLMEAALGPIAGEWLGVIADISPTEPQGGYQAITMNLSVAVP